MARDISYLNQLNDQQRAAVEYIDGPQLVIAGAGSGKTRVLAYKIVHLLNQGYEPWRIMALTFTNKAAREMRERISTLVGEDIARKIIMGTFHSVFARILRTHADRLGIKPGYTIYDAADSKNLVKTIIKSMDLDEKIYKSSTISSIISSAKNSLISPAAYRADRDRQQSDMILGRPMTASIYAAYVNRCKIASALDFDDLLYYMNILLRDNADIRQHYSKYFRYILVDEYQDTNFAQHMVIKQISNDRKGLCVVGDDAQSIYSFRGANISNILNLERSFPGLRTFKLERNYRSTENIINAAGSLIAHNRRQIPKNVYSENGAGQRVEVIRTYSDLEESFMVANRLTQVKSASGDSYNDFAILYRTNAQSRVLEESLRKRAIPYRIYGGLSFYQRKEVKDAVAYLRLALNPDDEEALRRVINIPARGIGETTLKKLTDAATANHCSLWHIVADPMSYGVNINKGTQNKIKSFADIIQTANNMVIAGETAYDIANAIYRDSHILDQYAYDTTPENVSKHENLKELLAGVHSYTEQAIQDGDDVGDGLPLTQRGTLAGYMADIALATDVDTTDADEQDHDRVTLMTIHAAKGLEFGNVFIVGVEDELLPSGMVKNDPEGVEEERRLLYVAITRAKRYCMMSYASSRYRNGQTIFTKASPFLRDIDTRYLRLSSPMDIADYRGAKHSSRATGDHTFTPRTHASNPASVIAPKTSASLQSTFNKQSGASIGSLHSADSLKVGTHIIHGTFGPGIIMEIDNQNAMGERIRVKFDNGEIKALLLKYARFEIVSD